MGDRSSDVGNIEEYVLKLKIMIYPQRFLVFCYYNVKSIHL